MIGTEIGNYRILEKLGEGGMGVVYKAVDTSLDRFVAMKVLAADLSRNPELVERFRAEARAQANLNHTNLATLYAFLVHLGEAFMVMEYIEGETFESMIRRRGPIPQNDSVPLFKQALLGIGYAHRAGIVHRDIKPSNIMLNKYGIVKVMDFGIAKVLGARSMTRTGTQMGTVAYMPPEQIQNRQVDIRTDIYALGITLYEMLSGRLPFDSDSDFKVMQDHVGTAPPPPSRFYPYIPKGLDNVVLKALEKDPNARYQTVEEFGAAIEHPESVSPPAPARLPVSAPKLEATLPTPTRGAVLETPSAMIAPPANVSLPATAGPHNVAVPSLPTVPKRAGAKSNQTLILVAAGVLLLALVAFGVYKEGAPKPHPITSVAQNSRGANSTDSDPQNGGQIQIDAGPPANNVAPDSQTAPPPPAPKNSAGHTGQNAAPPSANNRQSLTIPAGANVTVVTIDAIDSARNTPGQQFRAMVAAPVWVGSDAALDKGADARILLERDDFGGHSELRVRLISLNVAGAVYNVATNLLDDRGTSRGPAVRIPSETLLVFTLSKPLTVTVAQ